MLIPEIIIIKSLNSFVQFVKEDYNTASDKAKTILYDLFNEDDNGDRLAFEEKDNLLRSAKKLIIGTDEQVDYLKINIGFNRERAELGTPTIHILLPNESKGVMDAISDNEQHTTDGVTVFVDKSKSKRAVYHLMITSANMEEVLVLYYFWQAMFLIFNSHCALSGMLNLRMSGADINVQSEYPTVAYYRNCTLEFDYEYHVKTRLSGATIQAMNFHICADFVNDQITGLND